MTIPQHGAVAKSPSAITCGDDQHLPSGRIAIGGPMGTWGLGNFESDGALDYLDGLICQLTDTIVGYFNKDNADIGETSELMPTVAIMLALVKECHAAPPNADVIEGWRSKYLAIYDERIDALEPNWKYKAERRKIIDETFLELIQMATKFRAH